MPKKLITQEEQTQIGLIIDMLQRLEGKVDLAEAARHEREQTTDELVLSLKNSVKGNGKPGLEKDVLILQSRTIAMVWILAAIFGGVLADLVGHYSQYFK